jgi:phosphoribosylaminoimidazolecarboxamide formyltransferase/IMP cyclohydrolase
MIRAAAKNHGDVTVVVDPADYPELLAALASPGGVSEELRKRMAWKAYQHTASYDAQVRLASVCIRFRGGWVGATGSRN